MIETNKIDEGSSRVGKISIRKLFGDLTYSINLNTDERITIAYGPNGIGKTTLLRLLDALFAGNLLYITRVPFEELTVDFINGDAISVNRLNKDEKDKIHFTYHRDGKQGNDHFEIDVGFFTKSGGRDINAYIERYIPAVIQTGPDTWHDRRIDQSFSFDELIEAYGNYLPPKILSRAVKTPDWFKRVIKSTDIKLIETQRLFNIERNRGSRYTESSAETRNAVASFAEDLTQIISETLSKYAELSQSLDSTFPTRLVNQSGYKVLSGEDIVRDLNNLQLKRNSIMNVGILPKEGGAIAFSESSKIDGSENVLSLYIKDVSEKLGLFDEIILKMTILSNIVNSKFSRKTLVFDVRKGFIFFSKNGNELAYSKLSSGEQHEIVMLYELLFKTQPKSLIMIDEPEISLHVVWQQRYLDDISQITNLQPMDVLIMTHSPQIINNSWDLTYDIGEHLENA